jgi:hypothetical protein
MCECKYTVENKHDCVQRLFISYDACLQSLTCLPVLYQVSHSKNQLWIFLLPQ